MRYDSWLVMNTKILEMRAKLEFHGYLEDDNAFSGGVQQIKVKYISQM